jgi:aminoglycoside phosphotransferase (APT) family kinase protein
MATEVPCAACGWSTHRQDSCRYNSHVRLFYGVSDRGVWSVGSNLIIKERSDTPPNFEARTVRFLQNNTTIPVPDIIEEWSESDGSYFLVMKRIQGVPLKTTWPDMSERDRDRVAMQAAGYLAQLRNLRSSQLQSLHEQPLYSAFLFRNGFGIPHGPLTSDDQLWQEMAKALKGLSDKACRRLRRRMPPAAPYTFTHGDLTIENIIVADGNISGIIDWEASGYFPVWWEFTSTRISQGHDDRDWKALLRKHMEDHTDAHEFWLDYYALSRYPNLDERGVNLLRELESGDE